MKQAVNASVVIAASPAKLCKPYRNGGIVTGKYNKSRSILSRAIEGNLCLSLTYAS